MSWILIMIIGVVFFGIGTWLGFSQRSDKKQLLIIATIAMATNIVLAIIPNVVPEIGQYFSGNGILALRYFTIATVFLCAGRLVTATFKD